MVYLHIGITSVYGLFKHIGVKFGVARFDYSGQFPGRLIGEASDRWASRSYLFVLEIFFYHFDAKPHRD